MRGFGAHLPCVDIWNRVTEACASQDGVVARPQLIELGATGHQISYWLRTARLQRAAPRVYAVGGMPPTWRSQLRAGLLSLGPDAVVSHDAAAQLHGFDRSPPGRVEFTVPRPARPGDSALSVHTTQVLPPIDRCVVDGLAATSATRTVMDLARARVSQRRLEAAIDSAVRSGASAPVVLEQRLAALRGRGRWGCRRVEALLPDTGAHTMLERRFLELTRSAGLPRPRTQVVFRDGDRTMARVDFYYEEFGIVVEVSGRLGHSTPAERAADARRRNELQDHGLRVYEYTWEDVTRRRAYVVSSLRAALRDAGWSP